DFRAPAPRPHTPLNGKAMLEQTGALRAASTAADPGPLRRARVAGPRGAGLLGVAGGADVAAAEDGADGGVGAVGAGRVVDVRFQVDGLGDRDRGADAALDGVDAGGELRGGVVGADRDLRGHHQRLRADVHGAQVDDALDFWAVLDRGHDLPLHVRAGRLADQQAFRLNREDRRSDAEQQADRQRTRAVPDPVPGAPG